VAALFFCAVAFVGYVGLGPCVLQKNKLAQDHPKTTPRRWPEGAVLQGGKRFGGVSD